MTEEERQAFLMFAGTIHGQAKATDQMIVGHSVNLKPISTDIQHTFTQVLQTQPQQNMPYSQQEPTIPAAYQQAQPEPIIGVEQAIHELANTQSFVQSIPTNTQSNNNDIVSVLREINLNLSKIVITLESHVGQKRTENKKSA